MIHVHRLNNQPIVINAELIDVIEPHGTETLIGLATGNRIVVTESIDQVLERVYAYRRHVNQSGGNPLPPFLKLPSDVESLTAPEGGDKGGSPCR